MTNTAYRAAARRLFERDGVIEIEEFAQVEDADGDRPGVWVEGWLFIPDDEAAKESADGSELVCADVPPFLAHRVPLVNGAARRATRPC